MFYERRLDNGKLKSTSDFVDFAGHKWNQELETSKNVVRVGVDFKYQPAPVGFYGMLGVDYGKGFSGNGYRDYGVDLKFGYKFF